MSWFEDKVPKYEPNYVIDEPEPKLRLGTMIAVADVEEDEEVNVEPDPKHSLPSR